MKRSKTARRRWRSARRSEVKEISGKQKESKELQEINRLKQDSDKITKEETALKV